MSVLGVMSRQDRGTGAVLPNVQNPPDNTGFFQNISAGFTQSVAGPHSTQNAKAIYESRQYDQIIQALAAEGEKATDYVESPVRAGSLLYRPVPGEQVQPDGRVMLPSTRSFTNPFSEGPSLTRDINPLTNLYMGGDPKEISQIWSAVQRVRQRKPDFLKGLADSNTVDALAMRQREADAERAGAVTSRANLPGKIGGFIGGMAGSIASGDPENFVGGGFASAPAKSVARQVLTRAVEGAGANAMAGVIAVPGQASDAASMGQPMTTGDMAESVGQNAAAGFFLGGAHAALPHVAGAAGSAVGNVTSKALDIAATRMPDAVRDPIIAASIRAGTVKDRDLLHSFQATHAPYTDADTSTPTEKAAAHVVTRDIETQEQSPLQPEAVPAHNDRLSAVAKALGVDLTPPELPTSAPTAVATVPDRSEGATAPRRPASFVDGINHAEGSTRTPRSSADGYGNFLESTWLSVAPHVTDTAGMGRDQILALRHDKDIAGKATQYYAAQNGNYLRGHGLEDSPGNLSLAHFLGVGDAAKLLKAAPDTPVEHLLSPEVIHANHEVLQGKSADQVIAWAHKRIGSAVDHPPARPDAITDSFDYGQIPPHERTTLAPDEITTDAALMQYKSGGDENGVTSKLADVDKWNPLESSEVMVWQPNEGGNVVVDGHQRVGLAKRLYSEDPSIRLPAIVLKEADGITPEVARVLGALRNIKMGTGSLEDNARVLRDAPEISGSLKGAEHRSDIEGLARLSYPAFGAVLNNVIDPQIAAQIGIHAGHAPDTHMAMVGLLRNTHSPREAATITRQALADGFGTAEGEQLSLLGEAPQQSLYTPIARIMDAASRKLREEKRTFKVLSDKAGRIEAAGNVLDRTANESKVIGNDEALAILDRTAHRAGPVRDALIAAARHELSGARRADAVRQFLDALGGIDLREAAAGATAADGRVGELAGSEGGGTSPEAPDENLPSGSEPSLFDRAIAARDQAEPFSDPVGEGAKQQTALIEHDLKVEAVSEFRRWFGKSQVVDETGKPLTVYHGTNQPIDKFDLERLGAATKSESSQHGFFFTSDPHVASLYAESAAGRVVAGVKEFEQKSAELQKKVAKLEKEAQKNGKWDAYEEAMSEWENLEIEATREENSGQNVLPVHLALENPKTIDFGGETILKMDGGFGDAIAQAKEEGHDGLILRNIDDTPNESRVSDHYVAFSPDQIRSAIGSLASHLAKPELEAPAPEPVHLFDLPATGFRLSEEGNTVSIKDALEQSDADEAAAKALRDCL